MLDGPLKEATKRNQKYLRDLELDRLLHNFRVNAGIPSSAKPLDGWESPSTELRGHLAGHFLSACALMHASFDDVFLLTGNQQALDVVKKMADWAKRRTDRLSDEQMQKMLKVEFGGMSESLFNLYAITHDANHLALAKRFEKWEFLDPLGDYTDKLKGLHVNTHIPQVIAAARGYELTGEDNYWTISTFSWDQVVNARSYATGGTSNGEH